MLFIEIEAGNPVLMLANDVAPYMNGILELTLADGYVPQDGDIIPLMTSELVLQTNVQFSMILINELLEIRHKILMTTVSLMYLTC